MLVRGGGGDDHSPTPIELLVRSESLPQQPEPRNVPVGTFAGDERALRAAWGTFGLAGDPTVRLPTNGQLLFLGLVESSSCRAVLIGGKLSGDLFTVFATEGGSEDRSKDGGSECTSDDSPVTFVVVIPEDAERVAVNVDGESSDVTLLPSDV